jgi:hypothetical protein
MNIAIKMKWRRKAVSTMTLPRRLTAENTKSRILMVNSFNLVSRVATKLAAKRVIAHLPRNSSKGLKRKSAANFKPVNRERSNSKPTANTAAVETEATKQASEPVTNTINSLLKRKRKTT